MAKPVGSKSKPRLDAIDYKIINLEMTQPELTQGEIGKIVGLVAKVVGRRMAKPLYQQEYRSLLMPAVKMLERNKEKAAKKIIKLIEAQKSIVKDHEIVEVDDPSVQLKAADDILSKELRNDEQSKSITIIMDVPGLKPRMEDGN
jgi:DNA-binding Lrp family transcriptional regulator